MPHTHIFCIHSNHTHKNNNLLVFSGFVWVDTICHCRRCRHRHRRRWSRFDQKAVLCAETWGKAAKVFYVLHFIFYSDSNFVFFFFFWTFLFASVCIHINLVTFLCFLFFSRFVYFSLLSLCMVFLRFVLKLKQILYLQSYIRVYALQFRCLLNRVKSAEDSVVVATCRICTFDVHTRCPILEMYEYFYYIEIFVILFSVCCFFFLLSFSVGWQRAERKILTQLQKI